MNTFNTALVSAVSVVALAGFPAKADNLAIGLSPNGETALKKAEAKDTIHLLLETVDPGEQASVYNGLSGELICTFIVPDKRSYAAAKAKLNKNAGCVREILKFAESPDESDEAGAIDLTEFFRMLARQGASTPLETVVIFGSPIINDPTNPSLFMAGGRIPSDGHIQTARTNSPFSLSGFGKPLDGVAIHFASDGYRWAVNDQHEYLVRRFWSLSANALGAELTTFNADRNQLIQRVAQGVRQPVERFEASASEKLEMLQVRIDRGRYIPIYDRELSTERLEATTVAQARNVELGIKWDCPSCDLDIYARPYEGADVLYFGNTRTREGL